MAESSTEAEASQDESIHVFWDQGMLNHDTGRGVFDSGLDPGFLDVLEPHPENSDRVKNMISILKRGPIAPFVFLGIKAALPSSLNCSLSTPKVHFFLFVFWFCGFHCPS